MLCWMKGAGSGEAPRWRDELVYTVVNVCVCVYVLVYDRVIYTGGEHSVSWALIFVMNDDQLTTTAFN